MQKNDIISRINNLVEMLYITGQQKGFQEAGEIFTSGSVTTASVLGSDKAEGSDPHPVMPPIKPWNAKSFTIKIDEENNTLTLLVDNEERSKHTSTAAAIKFEQLLMQAKDQFSSWNATATKEKN
jgi:hypothetical protein|tara:strand:+ start:303 stop:677 length:375 start_codon:yes stop_codon:yes gene_type:complete